MVIQGDDVLVVDKNKVRRERERLLASLRRNVGDVELQALYFDGRKDSTFVYSQSKRKMIVEEHVTLVQEPSSRYLEHVTPCVSKAIGLKDSIMHFLAEKMINIDGLQAIECDGTAVNTGRYAGVIRRI